MKDNDRIERYHKGALQGDVDDQISLAQLYEKEGSVDEAIFWYRKAAKQGDVDAQFFLARLYEKEGSIDEAIFWYRKAAEQGDAVSQRSLAQLYEKQGSVDEAIFWYRKAAEQGNDYAQENLAQLYEKQGSIDEAIFWYRKVAEQGKAYDQHSLAELYEKQGSVDEAIFWYRKAAEQGKDYAQKDLAKLYEKQGSIDDAITWYRKAAEQGHAQSQYNLGKLLAKKGQSSESLLWIKKAAYQEEERALLFLAMLYCLGSDEEKIEKDRKLGYEYLTSAAKLGNKTAISILNVEDTVLSELFKDEQEKKEFANYINKKNKLKKLSEQVSDKTSIHPNHGDKISDKATKMTKPDHPIKPSDKPSVTKVNTKSLPEKNSNVNWMKWGLMTLLLCGIAGLGFYFINRSNSNTLNEDNNTNVVVESLPTDANSNEQSLKEEITKSLEELFNEVMKGKKDYFVSYPYDKKYFSSDFNRMYNSALEIATLFNEVFMDWGFWDNSQDCEKLTITLNDVYDIKNNEAMAKVTFINGSVEYAEPQNEEIKVVFENGKWVLDDVHGYKELFISYVKDSASRNAEEIQTGDVEETAPVEDSVIDDPVIEEEEEDADMIYQVVENQPEFPGGTSALMQYLGNYIQYPEASQEKGVQGRVVVLFIVNKDGSISDPVVARSVDPNLDKEALRLVSSMPKWKPGMQRGKPVRVRYTLPVAFKFQ